MAEDNVSDTNDPDQPVFSLVTGKYRHAKRYGGMYRLALMSRTFAHQDTQTMTRSQVLLRIHPLSSCAIKTTPSRP